MSMTLAAAKLGTYHSERAAKVVPIRKVAK
jgi:hypothetical protein